jgi:hypothetical protein
MWAIAERNSAVKKALDEYYQKLYSMLFGVLKQAAPKNYQGQKMDNAVVILLPFIEGYVITASNLTCRLKRCPNNWEASCIKF